MLLMVLWVNAEIFCISEECRSKRTMCALQKLAKSTGCKKLAVRLHSSLQVIIKAVNYIKSKAVHDLSFDSHVNNYEEF